MLIGAVAVAAITLFGPRSAIVVAWIVAALAIAGAGLAASPSVQLRGSVNRLDGDPRDRDGVKHP